MTGHGKPAPLSAKQVEPAKMIRGMTAELSGTPSHHRDARGRDGVGPNGALQFGFHSLLAGSPGMMLFAPMI